MNTWESTIICSLVLTGIIFWLVKLFLSLDDGDE